MSLRDPTAWMWGEALDLLASADKLHRQFFQLGHHHNRCPTWEPPVDVFETEFDLIVIAALPGVEAQCIEVRMDGAALILQGRCAIASPCSDAMIHRLEIPYGRFERRIELLSDRYRIGNRIVKDGCLVQTLSKTG